VILLIVVAILLLLSIAMQLAYWRNVVSLGVDVPRTLQAIMGVNIAVLTVALFVTVYFGYAAAVSGEM